MNRDTIQRLAELAQLDFDAVEEARAAHRIERLLTFFARLEEVDTDSVEPSPYPLPLTQRTRADVTEPPLARDDVLAAAPEVRGGCFRVPRTVTG